MHTLLNLLKQQNYQHITVSPATHEIINARDGNKFAINLVDILGWSRPFIQGTIAPDIFKCMKDANILEKIGNAWCSRIRISTIGSHYFIHSPYPTTQIDAVFFGPDTYRFTHALTQYFAVNPTPVLRAIDICTGCGPAAILIANNFPKAQVYGVDINSAALDFAMFNASFNNIGNVSFTYSNLLNDVDGEFDFITANPPFLVDASKRAYRHGGGMFGYQLSLDIINAALNRLSPGGTLLLYTGVAIINGKDLFLEEVKNKLVDSDLDYVYEEIDPDIFADELLSEPYYVADRIAAVLLVVRKNLISVATQ